MFPLQKCSFKNLKILRIVANLHGCENCLAAVRDQTWRPCDMSNAKNSCKLTCWPPWIVGSLVLKRFNIEWQPSVTKHDGQVWHEQCEKLTLSHFRLACMNRGSLVLKLLIMNFNLNFFAWLESRCMQHTFSRLYHWKNFFSDQWNWIVDCPVNAMKLRK